MRYCVAGESSFGHKGTRHCIAGKSKQWYISAKRALREIVWKARCSSVAFRVISRVKYDKRLAIDLAEKDVSYQLSAGISVGTVGAVINVAG